MKLKNCIVQCTCGHIEKIVSEIKKVICSKCGKVIILSDSDIDFFKNPKVDF